MPRFSTVRMPLVVSRRVTQRFSVSTQKRCVCRLGRKRRRVLLLAWETRFPTAGFLPVTSQTRDIRLTLRDFSSLEIEEVPPEPRFIPARRRDHKLSRFAGGAGGAQPAALSMSGRRGSAGSRYNTNDRNPITGRNFMTLMTRVFCAAGALLSLTSLATTAYADGRDWNDGPVINVSSIRTVDGHFDDYMHWLATTYKKQQEASKKAGLITAYRVIVVEARGPNDPDILLITEFKNSAALDGLGRKFDAVSTQIEGSLEKANQSQADRAKIRTVLGSRTAQEALLK